MIGGAELMSSRPSPVDRETKGFACNLTLLEVGDFGEQSYLLGT